MGPSQICGCPFREPRVFEIAHLFFPFTTKKKCKVKTKCFQIRKTWSYLEYYKSAKSNLGILCL